MTTAFITHPACSMHEMGEYHPESPARLDVINDRLIEAGLFDLLSQFEAPKASRKQLELVHDADYIDSIENHAPTEGYLQIDSDTLMNSSTVEAAYRAAGAVIQGVDLVLSGAADNAYCNIRPPGHHAESNKAMGFCFFNNIAVGASYALKQPQIKTVLIADFDAHFGNGTEQIFSTDENVFICSSFQHPHYPLLPHQQGSERIINVTLKPGTPSAEFRQQIEKQWFPAIEAFKPDMFFISAGFDGHFRDPLCELMLTDNDYYWVTQHLVKLADKYADGRIVSSLEGGYDLNALGACAVAHLRAMLKI